MGEKKETKVVRPAYLELVNENTINECKRAMKLVRNLQMSFTAPGEIEKMFTMSQEIIAIQAWLVGELMAAEQSYRLRVEEFRVADWNRKNSVTTAEVAAKATAEYSAYRFLQYVYDLCTDQINLIKKFSDKVGDERANIGIRPVGR